MKDIWYADNRDLVKWAILLRLAGNFKAKRILQIAFYRPSEFKQIEIDGQKEDIPKDVISYFRDIRNICQMKSMIPVEVFDLVFENRRVYTQKVIKYLSTYRKERLIVFLDPDTGLEPVKTKHKPEHVLEEEAKEIWEALKLGDVFVFYQHQTNRRGNEWINPKKNQLAHAIDLPVKAVKCAYGLKIAKDGVLFYAEKNAK